MSTAIDTARIAQWRRHQTGRYGWGYLISSVTIRYQAPGIKVPVRRATMESTRGLRKAEAIAQNQEETGPN
jgi:hypothetical protein